MTLSKLFSIGVRIDPKPAAEGAEKVSRAAEGMAKNVKSSAASAEDALRKMGAGAKEAANATASAAPKVDTYTRASASAKTTLDAFKRAVDEKKRALNESERALDSNRRAMSAGSSIVRAMTGAITGLGAAINFATGALFLLTAPIKVVSAGFDTLHGAITKAGDFEGYSIQFAQLLGSFDAADKKLQDITRLAAETPFSLDELVKGSAILQNLSSGALATQEQLRLMTDVAARAKLPFDELAVTVGRLYNNLKSGTADSMPINRLIETGVLTDPKAILWIKQMQESGNEMGKSFEQIWSVLDQQFRKAEGSGLLMSQTVQGLESTLGDVWDRLQRIFGAGLAEGYKPILRELIGMFDQWGDRLEELRPQIADIAKEIAAMFSVAGQEGGFTLLLQTGIQKAMEFLNSGLSAASTVLDSMMKRGGYELEQALNKVNDPAFWNGLSTALYNAAATFINTLMAGVEQILPKLNNAGKPASYMGYAGDVLDIMRRQITDDFTPEQRATMGNNSNGRIDVTPLLDQAFGNRFGDDPVPTGGQIQFVPLLPAERTSLLLPPPPPSIVSPSGAMAAENLFGGRYNSGPSVEEFLLNTRLSDARIAMDRANAGARDDSLLARSGNPFDLVIPDKEKMAEAKRDVKELQGFVDSMIRSTRTPLEELQTTMSKLDKARSAGMITAEDHTRLAAKATEDYEKAVEKAGATTERVLGRLESPLQQLMNNWGNLGARVQELSVNMAHSISENITQAVTAWATGTMSMEQAFNRMAMAVIGDIIQMTTRMLIQWAISRAIGFAAGVHHTGGVVGDAATTRFVSPKAFNNAPRFNHGGAIPSGERAVIAEPGETVLTRAQAGDIKEKLSQKEAKNTPQSVNIVNIVDPRLMESFITSNPGVIMNVIASNSRTVKQLLSS